MERLRRLMLRDKLLRAGMRRKGFGRQGGSGRGILNAGAALYGMNEGPRLLVGLG